jgi:hypothetical protein
MAREDIRCTLDSLSVTRAHASDILMELRDGSDISDLQA